MSVTYQQEQIAEKAIDPNVGGGVDRSKLADSDFVFPDERKFPIVTAGDVSDAVSSWGRYKGSRTFAEFKRLLTSLAKRKGFASALPAAWKKNSATKSWWDEIKAEPMTTAQYDRWLKGEIPRRILMLPFGGPNSAEVFGYPHDDKGRDLDGEYFDERTDVYGPYPTLRASRERIVDWHHDMDPTGVMAKAILGHVVFDQEPEDLGYWADYWTNAGERRRRYVEELERRHVPLYGSTQAIKGTRQKWPPEADGHLAVWPIVAHTLSTSPQNLRAVVPPLKALLSADDIEEIGWPALKAALAGLDADERRLSQRLQDGGSGFRPAGKGAGKAGRVISKRNEARIMQALSLVEEFLQEHRARLEALSAAKENLTSE